ncbi:MAG: 50S ribosomal protein L44e [Methanobacteriota archaeon]|nr:MAG: 50S ribosomal protein L44e [Euryarchaeota archaeon]
MKVPAEIRTHCPYCNAHTTHKVKLASKGPRRTLAEGELRHARKLKGHGGKRAGKKDVVKQAKRQKLMLTCQQCNKKHELVLGSRTRKKAEIKR